MIDTHCHLDFPAYDGDRAAVLARAHQAGVARVVVPGTSPRTWDRTRAVCERHGMCALALGLHPWFLGELSEEEEDAALRALPEVLAGAVALGECGLDGAVARRGGASMERQERTLRAQLRIARDLELPVLLHCVKAHGRLLALLQETPVRGLLHGYSGSAEMVPRYLDLGLDFAFGGPITWPEAKRPVAALLAVPLERLHLESDGPDQAPAPFRGQRSEPAHLKHIAARVRELKGGPAAGRLF